MDSHNKIRKETKRNNKLKIPQHGDILVWNENIKDWETSNKIINLEQTINIVRNKQNIITKDNDNDKLGEHEIKINNLSKKIDKILKILY